MARVAHGRKMIGTVLQRGPLLFAAFLPLLMVGYAGHALNPLNQPVTKLTDKVSVNRRLLTRLA